MLIFSRKKLEFRVDDKGSTIAVEPLVFKEVPESVKNDNLFKWALADGTIEVVESKTQQKKLENDPMPVIDEIKEEIKEEIEKAQEEIKPSKKK